MTVTGLGLQPSNTVLGIPLNSFFLLPHSANAYKIVEGGVVQGGYVT